MGNLSNIKPENVFKIFEDICAVPRGSGNMDGITAFCMDFAQNHGLKAVKDNAGNVVIYKAATPGFENCEPIILQGHLDMVCQKAEGVDKDFLTDGIVPIVDGDYVTAEGTTLGADNGIAVAIAMAILTDDTLKHPPIEALFTTDEEIGLIGASKLDASNVKGRKMINIDAEEEGKITVSCAGGSDFAMSIPVKREKKCGKLLKIAVKGLKGGHSGMEINNFCENANVLTGRLLKFADDLCGVDIVSVDGGDKGNAIPNSTVAYIVADKDITSQIKQYADVIKKEILTEEPGFCVEVSCEGDGEYSVFDGKAVLFAIVNAPNGVLKMSADVEDLVETSLNLGILKTTESEVVMQYALRSNKKTSLLYLEQRLQMFGEFIGANVKTSGHYPPWEYKNDSKVRDDYVKVFEREKGYKPEIVAIHAGLECGILSEKLDGLDCIAIGPECSGAHTIFERVSIPSVAETYNLIVKFLENSK